MRLRRALPFALPFIALLLAAQTTAAGAQRRAPRAAKPAPASAAATTKTPAAAGTVTVRTEPKAVVWLDDLRRGTTDDSGTLVVKNVSAGRHTLRVRARGFAERTLALLPTQRGTVSVALKSTTDEAELAFQDAEELSARGAESRAQAAEAYRRAFKLRPRFPEAHLALARLLLASDDYDAALEEIAAARRLRTAYAEASAVEGRVLRELAEYDGAAAAYARAIREGRGFQPEAHTGLGILLTDRGDHAGAADSFRKAVAQLADTEPVVYQLLGASYEKQEKWKEAVAAYEKYLALAPDGRLAPAIRSIIDQLRQQAAEQQ